MVSWKAKVIIAATPHPPETLFKKQESAYRRIADQIRRDYQKTVSTWSKKPKFSVIKVKNAGGGYQYEVSTDSTIYGYVDKGTEAHDIVPKPDNPTGKLWFKSPYKAKTQPNLLGSRAGGIAANARLYTATKVRHPGTQPRNFTKIIMERFRKKVVEEQNQILREWVSTLTEPKKR